MDTTKTVRDPAPTDDTTRTTGRTAASGAVGKPGPALDSRCAGPTVPRMALGAQLRLLREECGLTRDQAGEAIGVSRSKISRLELGRTGGKPHDVSALLDLYGATDEAERALMHALAVQSGIPGWWQRYGEVIPSWLHDYLGAEQAASVIRSFETQFVPGLLQTAEYARAVVRLEHGGAPAAELDRRVELRMRRQEILHREEPPRLWVVLDESVLHRTIGDAAVMRGQLNHLLAMAELPHVTVQILTFGSGGHGALCGPITMLRLPGGRLPDKVYLEQLNSAVYPDRPAEVTHYWDVLNRLFVHAEPSTATPALLARLRDGCHGR